MKDAPYNQHQKDSLSNTEQESQIEEQTVYKSDVPLSVEQTNDAVDSKSPQPAHQMNSDRQPEPSEKTDEEKAKEMLEFLQLLLAEVRKDDEKQ